jgi:hypothetical protein
MQDTVCLCIEPHLKLAIVSPADGIVKMVDRAGVTGPRRDRDQIGVAKTPDAEGIVEALRIVVALVPAAFA